jgi:hypothetical protein
MLSAQGALRRNPRRRQRPDRSRDVLAASLAANHERSLVWRSLKHGISIGENKAKVIHSQHKFRFADLNRKNTRSAGKADMSLSKEISPEIPSNGSNNSYHLIDNFCDRHAIAGKTRR